MALSLLREFLDEKKIKYVVISHSVAYTAQRVAASAHISGKELAKVVVVKVDDELAMAVLPASRQIDLGKLKIATGAKTIELASERDFRGRFSDCETGAMPPFGNLYGLKVYADVSLTNDKEIAFNAGTHRDLVRLAWKDFTELATPKIAEFATGRSRQRAA